MENSINPWSVAEFALTQHERVRLNAINDALIFEAFKLSENDVTHIISSFPGVNTNLDPELRHPVLALIAFHDLKQKGLDAFLAQNNGEGWLIPETLRLADYGLGHDERARESQPVAGCLGPRFLPWQLEELVEESWAECERHAENLRLLLGGPAPSAGVATPPPDSTPPLTDLFGEPLQRDLFGNVVYSKKKTKKG